MRKTVKTLIALAVAAATVWPAGAAARVHHGVKYHRGRHQHVRHWTHRPLQGQRLILDPGEPPGYRYGGPLYSTCDRINADRMLVGTCR